MVIFQLFEPLQIYSPSTTLILLELSLILLQT